MNLRGALPRTPTQRQAQVVQLIAEGMSSIEIATLLRISDRTVRLHAYMLRKRIGARNTAHAIAIGMREGFLR